METSSGAAAGEVGWYVLGPNQETVGPYALAELQEHCANGYFNEATMLWAEGRSQWMPLASIPELSSVITAKGQPEPGAAAPPVAEDDLEKFQKEIVEAEAEVVEALKGGGGEDGGANQEVDERPATPPDGEEEFTDDDGTIYKWDRTLRAWVPQNDVPDKKEGYALEEMTFALEEEVFQAPEIPDPSTLEEINLPAENKNKDSDKTEKKGDKKRKSSEKPVEKKEANKPPESWFDLKVNTHVYVNGLPDDVTLEEIVEVFSKCGIIKEDLEAGDCEDSQEEKAAEIVPVIPYTTSLPLDRQAKNYTVLDLDGNQIEIRNRWRRSVLDYRLWCYNTSDRRYSFEGLHQRCCTLPPTGNFLVYMHCKGRWLCAVIDGPSGYLDGYVTRSVGKKKDVRVYENSEMHMQERVKFIEHAERLPWDGGYTTAGKVICGDLVWAFEIMYRHVEGIVPGSSKGLVTRAGETLILHLAEAGRSDILFLDTLHRMFRAKNRVGGKLVGDARIWRAKCDHVYDAIGIVDTDFEAEPIRRRRAVTMITAEVEKMAKENLQDIRLLHRRGHQRGFFLLKNLPVQLTEQGPVDAVWAEVELQKSHNHDLGNSNWGFLTERFPKFPE